MIHRIKIEQHYLINILEGKKNFEIRKNDRDYQVGHEIIFLPLASENYDVHEIVRHIPRYKIIYVHQGYGMADGFAALGIEEIKQC